MNPQEDICYRYIDQVINLDGSRYSKVAKFVRLDSYLKDIVEKCDLNDFYNEIRFSVSDIFKNYIYIFTLINNKHNITILFRFLSLLIEQASTRTYLDKIRYFIQTNVNKEVYEMFLGNSEFIKEFILFNKNILDKNLNLELIKKALTYLCISRVNDCPFNKDILNYNLVVCFNASGQETCILLKRNATQKDLEEAEERINRERVEYLEEHERITGWKGYNEYNLFLVHTDTNSIDYISSNLEDQGLVGYDPYFDLRERINQAGGFVTREKKVPIESDDQDIIEFARIYQGINI